MSKMQRPRDDDLDDREELLCHPNDFFDVPSPRQLRAMRYLAGLSHTKVADELNVDPDTIINWEQGHTHPRGPDYEALFELYAEQSDGQQQLQL